MPNSIFKFVVIVILISAFVLASVAMLITFVGTSSATFWSVGIVFAKYKAYSNNMSGFYQHKRYDLKHYLFNWIMTLFGISKVEEEAIPHESPFICPQSLVGEAVPVFDDKTFFGYVVHGGKNVDPSLIKQKNNVDKTFYIYPTFGTMKRACADGKRDNGLYTNTGTVFFIRNLVGTSYDTHWKNRPVTVTIHHNRVQIRTTLRGKCVFNAMIPAPLDSLADKAIHVFPNVRPIYPYNKMIAQNFPPAPYGDPIVGTEGWIKENLAKGSFYADLSRLAEKKKEAKEYEWYSQRLAFVTGKIGASKTDNPFLPNNGWGIHGNDRKDVQERFTETFRCYPYDMKHVTVGKAYKFGTVLGWVKDAGLSTLDVQFNLTKEEQKRNDPSAAEAAAKEFYKELRIRCEKYYHNPFVPNYVGDCCRLEGTVVVATTSFAAKEALLMLGYSEEQIDKMLDNTNFKDDWYPYPVFFELSITARAVELTKNSPEIDDKPSTNYVDFYKQAVARKSEDKRTEFANTYLDPYNFMVPLSEIKNRNQNLHGFSEPSP